MKKEQKKLSLERFNIARLTVNTHYIFGGGRTEHTDLCHTGLNTSCHTTCTTDPQSDSSLECFDIEKDSDNGICSI